MTAALVLLKPDVVEARQIGEVITRFERKGYQIICMNMLHPSEELIKEHYIEHKDKPFYENLCKSFQHSYVVSMMVLKFPHTICPDDHKETSAEELWKVFITDLRSFVMKLREEFAKNKTENSIHASDSPAAAERELKLWFPEIVDEASKKFEEAPVDLVDNNNVVGQDKDSKEDKEDKDSKEEKEEKENTQSTVDQVSTN